MVSNIFYELKDGKILLYDKDGGFDKEQPHLRYLRQADYTSTTTSESLEMVLQTVIAEQLPKIPRRVKNRNRPGFDFIARPLTRDNPKEQLPIISDQYTNPHYQVDFTVKTEQT